MKQKLRKNLLGVYDLILSFGVIYIGILMIRSISGIFIEYPKKWLSKLGLGFIFTISPIILYWLIHGDYMSPDEKEFFE